MTATLTAGFQTHIAGRSHKRCRMLRLDFRDGSMLGFTDHDSTLAVDLSDGDGSVSYRHDLGMVMSNLQTGCGLDAGNCEITIPIGAEFTRAGVLGGRYNYAEARIFEVLWSDLSLGARKFMLGNATEWRLEGGKAIAEIRDLRDKYNQVVGRTITNQCWKDFADGVFCTATATEIVGTVTAVNDALHFTVSFSGTYADDFFNLGTVIGLTGANAGTTVEIEDWTEAGAIVLFAPLAEEPAIGDTFTVRNGCSKLRLSDDPDVPTCKTYDNVLEFGGYPEVPGSDQVLRTTLPGQGNG